MTTRALRQPPVTLQPAAVLAVLGLGMLAVCAAFAAVGLERATALLLGMLFVIPAVLTAIVRRAMARGEFRDVDPDHAAMLIAAPMLQLMMWRNALEPQSEFKIDPLRYLESHLEALARGLGARRGAQA